MTDQAVEPELNAVRTLVLETRAVVYAVRAIPDDGLSPSSKRWLAVRKSLMDRTWAQLLTILTEGQSRYLPSAVQSAITNARPLEEAPSELASLTAGPSERADRLASNFRAIVPRWSDDGYVSDARQKILDPLLKEVRRELSASPGVDD